MGTLNTGAPTPEAPQKVSAIPGLGTKIMTALATLGIAASAEKVEAATILPFSTPTLVPGSSSNITQQVGFNEADLRLFATTAGGLRESLNLGASRFTVTAPANGVLTISWDSIIGTGTAPGQTQIETRLGQTVSYDVNQRVKFGLAGGDMNEIAFIDGPAGTSESDGYIPVGFNVSSTHSTNVNVLAGQTYNFDMGMEYKNTPAFIQNDNIKFSFVVPEPSSAVLGAGGIAALLLRRKREKTEKGE